MNFQRFLVRSFPASVSLGLVYLLFLVAGVAQAAIVPLLPRMSAHFGLSASQTALLLALPGLATLAQAQLDQAMENRSGGDITRVIQKLFDRQADLFPIRDQGGVYFVPIAHTAFVDRVQNFVGRVAGKLARFPVPAGTVQGDRSVRDAVAEGLSAAIEEHRAAIAEFDDDTRKATFRRSAERIRMTRFKLEAYADLLAEREYGESYSAVIVSPEVSLDNGVIFEMQAGTPSPGGGHYVMEPMSFAVSVKS